MNFFSGIPLEKTKAADPDPFFTITLLAPNTTTLRNEWIPMIANELPKIGIGVELNHVGWNEIYPRTFSYTGPYPIPTFSEGGYDMLIIGFGTPIDFNPLGIYDSPGIIPYGSNYYQYNNPVMDSEISNYQDAYLFVDRMAIAEDIQGLLYEDLPQTSIFFDQSLYPMDVNFDNTSWDGVLWQQECQSMENWAITSETEFHYATPGVFSDFHIHFYDAVYDAQWLHQIYNGLVERALGTHQYTNHLATSYETTDGLTWTVDINPNAVWADGIALTAYDVNYSYNLLIDPAYAHTYYSYWTQYVDSDSINIISDYEFEITFLQPYLFHENNLALDLIPRHIWNTTNPEDHETQAATWATSDPNKLMGAGPYYLENYDDSNKVIHLTVNPYFDDWSSITPNFDDIYFEYYSTKFGALSALSAGAVDMVDTYYNTPIDEVPGGTTYQLVDEGRFEELGFNCLHPIIGTGALCPISSPDSGMHIRKAISHMIPRQTIVDDVYDGIGKPGVTGWNHIALGYDETLDPYDYNIETAKNHMRAAGYVYPEDITPTNTTTSLTPTSSISGIAFGSVIAIIATAGSIIVIVRYKKQKLS
ncbi:MAG: ABC transporter substrate-binding protein [Candidatus Heimdallarchaeota archaeon]